MIGRWTDKHYNRIGPAGFIVAVLMGVVILGLVFTGVFDTGAQTNEPLTSEWSDGWDRTWYEDHLEDLEIRLAVLESEGGDEE